MPVRTYNAEEARGVAQSASSHHFIAAMCCDLGPGATVWGHRITLLWGTARRKGEGLPRGGQVCMAGKELGQSCVPSLLAGWKEEQFY